MYISYFISLCTSAWSTGLVSFTMAVTMTCFALSANFNVEIDSSALSLESRNHEKENTRLKADTIGIRVVSWSYIQTHGKGRPASDRCSD